MKMSVLLKLENSGFFLLHEKIRPVKGGSHREVFNPTGLRQSAANVKTNRAVSLNCGTALWFIWLFTEHHLAEQF